MKTNSLLFAAMMIAFSFSCFSQQSESASAKIGNAQLLADAINGDELVVVSYRVEERINMNFGSSITSYTVSNLNMVNTTDLGPNNTRTVTPVFAKARVRAKSEVLSTASLATPNAEAPKAAIDIPVPASPIKTEPAPIVKKDGIAIVDIIATYERILDKGYQSIDMLKRVGNSRFYDGDLTIAAKWYTQLFALTKDLEPEYYYRYAQSLKSVNQVEKAKEMMAVFEKANP